jgi:hypothetical protein
MSTLIDASEAFHRHLDECKQCENQPFDLCPTGTRLLEETGVAAGILAPAKEPRGRRRSRRRRDGKGKRRKR